MQIYTNFESNSQPNTLSFCTMTCCFRCKYTQILKAIHNKQLVPIILVMLFPMQIYTNFESNSQLYCYVNFQYLCCFRCKYTQILKAIHNFTVTSISNTLLFPMQIYTNFESNSQHISFIIYYFFCCFRCKYTQILKAIHNLTVTSISNTFVVSDANIHKF